jgi:hypothetical protein
VITCNFSNDLISKVKISISQISFKSKLLNDHILADSAVSSYEMALSSEAKNSSELVGLLGSMVIGVTSVLGSNTSPTNSLSVVAALPNRVTESGVKNQQSEHQRSASSGYLLNAMFELGSQSHTTRWLLLDLPRESPAPAEIEICFILPTDKCAIASFGNEVRDRLGTW